jgi:hypothetical protein
LANIDLNSSSGLSYIVASFTNPHSTPIIITPLGLTIGGTILDELLNYGFWTIIPDAGTYNYDVTLTSRGHTNQGATAASHAVIKRPNSSVDWVSEGTHNNVDQSMGAGWVTSIRRNLTVFSDFAIAKSNEGSLPVEMIKFNASLLESNALIEWATASETNCSHFVLERSVGDQYHFEQVSTISGAGNSNLENYYSFVDNRVESGINYYKLTQYDFDGSSYDAGFDYVIINDDNASLSVANFTVHNGLVAADIYNITGAGLIIEILDNQGRLIHSLSFVVEEDAYRMVLSESLSSGIYFLRVSDAKQSVSVKFLSM